MQQPRVSLSPEDEEEVAMDAAWATLPVACQKLRKGVYAPRPRGRPGVSLPVAQNRKIVS